MKLPLLSFYSIWTPISTVRLTKSSQAHLRFIFQAAGPSSMTTTLRTWKQEQHVPKHHTAIRLRTQQDKKLSAKSSGSSKKPNRTTPPNFISKKETCSCKHRSLFPWPKAHRVTPGAPPREKTGKRPREPLMQWALNQDYPTENMDFEAKASPQKNTLGI